MYVQPATAGKQLLRYHLLVLNLVSCAESWLQERIGKYATTKTYLQYISSYLVTNLKYFFVDFIADLIINLYHLIEIEKQN